MKFFILKIILILSVIIAPSVNAAESIKADHVQIRWLAPEEFGSNPTTIGVYFQIDPEWHVYWKNPGDSGTAPKFNIKSEDALIKPIEWPFPKRLPIAHLTNLGYEKAVAYLFEIKPNKSSVHLEAKLEWLVCKEECIPGFGTLTLDRSVNKANSIWNSENQKIVQEFQKRIPSLSDQSDWVVQSAKAIDKDLYLNIVSPQPKEKPPELFPLDGDFVSPAKPVVTKKEDGFEVVFKIVSDHPPNKTGFVLVSDDKAWEFLDVPLSFPPNLLKSSDSSPLWVLILTAFVGGILLNLMPCVFPVLSIKIFSLLRKHGGEPKVFKTRLHEGLAYSAGVVATFAFLGALFLGLRAAGASIGWGFQLQSPTVILALIVLFWLIALNFLGVFEFGYSVMNLAGKGGNSSSSFATGVLSVFVAAPCTGPFMGSALGASTTLPAFQAMIIFIALGAGLAFPFLLLALTPSLLSRLPKPGVWMERFKQFLAFPLFATVLWLLWVLGEQTGNGGFLIGGGLILILSFSIWLFQSKHRLLKAMALLFLAFGALISFKQISEAHKSETQSQKGIWSSYDFSAISSAQKEKRPVFVDFTAAWCITCQVNKKTVLETDAATQIFKKNNVLTIRADWTNQNPIITEALAKFGRSSVPLYVFYPADGSNPKILPQLLTFSMIEELFNLQEKPR